MFTFAFKEALRRLWNPTFEEQLSPLEKDIMACFNETRTDDARAVVICCHPETRELTGFTIPRDVNPKYFFGARTAKATGGSRMIAALEASRSFESQWSLKLGMLEDPQILMQYPLIQVAELKQPLPQPQRAPVQ